MAQIFLKLMNVQKHLLQKKTHVPEVFATVLLGEVDLLWCEVNFLFDIYNWTGSGEDSTQVRKSTTVIKDEQ